MSKANKTRKTLAERYQDLCIAEGREMDWTPEECKEYRTWAKLEAAARAQWAEEDETGEEEKTYNMSQHIALYRARYQMAISATGNKSLNNGDAMAEFLEGKTGKEVCDLADVYTPNKDGQPHFERYARLNEGQKRMNSGNKLRAAYKAGKIDITETGIKVL